MNVKTVFIGCLFFMACRSQHAAQSPLLPLGGYTASTPVDDSMLKLLQLRNRVVLAYTIEDYAWTRNATNYVLALDNNGWKAYSYKASLTSNIANNTTRNTLQTFNIRRATGDSVLQVFANEQAWKIQGDSGSNFCQIPATGNGAVTVCNITDQPTYELRILQGGSYSSASYYAPAYFEKCCPGNADRKKFLQLTSLLEATVTGKPRQ